MPSQLYQFAATIPAGTPVAAPVTVPLAMPARLVRRIEVLVPPGPAGVMGFALGAAGQAVIPANPGGWIVTDDAQLAWDLEGQIESGAWQLIGYNKGTFSHTVYVRFLTDLPVAVAPAGPNGDVLPAADLATIPDAAAVVPVPSAADLAALPGTLAAAQAAALAGSPPVPSGPLAGTVSALPVSSQNAVE